MLKPASLRFLVATIIAFTAPAPLSWSSEAYPPLVATAAGRAVSTAFLVELTNPLKSKPRYRVGIVLGNYGSGVLVPPKGVYAEVEYITSADQENILGSRTLVHAEAGLAGFYKVLQSALSVPVDLAGQAGQIRRISKPPTDYRIQITTDGATLSLSSVSETVPALEDVLNPLMTMLDGCAAAAPVSVAQEYSFNCGAAGLLRETRPGQATR